MKNEQGQVNAKSAETEYIETPVKTIFKKFANQKDVSLVYGEPVEHGLQKIVPVAKVSYAVGGGGDGNGGEGGGGSFRVKPVGVYVITPDQVKFTSTLDVKKITALTILIGGLLGVLSALRRK